MNVVWVMLIGLAVCQAADNKQFFADDPELDKIRADCKKQTKVKDDIAEKIDTGDIDNDSVEKDHNAKCYVSCVLEKSEFAKSGPPSLENIRKLLSLSDPGGMVEIVKKCWSEGKHVGSNSCDGRFVVFKCIMKNSQKTLRSGNEDNKPNDDKSKDNEQVESGEKNKDSKVGSNEKTVSDAKSKDEGKDEVNRNSGDIGKDDDNKSGKDVNDKKSEESKESAGSDSTGKDAKD